MGILRHPAFQRAVALSVAACLGALPLRAAARRVDTPDARPWLADRSSADAMADSVRRAVEQRPGSFEAFVVAFVRHLEASGDLEQAAMALAGEPLDGAGLVRFLLGDASSFAPSAIPLRLRTLVGDPGTAPAPVLSRAAPTAAGPPLVSALPESAGVRAAVDPLSGIGSSILSLGP